MKTILEVKELCEDIKTCMMATVDAAGQIRTRPMQLQEVDLMNSFWFFTNEYSSQAEQIESNIAVNLAFADKANDRYVAVNGFGDVVRDREKIKQLYNPMIKAWFPKGLDDPDLCLLKISPVSAEYWESGSGKIGQMFGIAKAIVTGTEYNQGEHARLEM